MDKQHTIPDDAAPPALDKSRPAMLPPPQEMPAPSSDQTNPHNQEPAGQWVASGRAADRKNNEPGMTEEERNRRRW